MFNPSDQSRGGKIRSGGVGSLYWEDKLANGDAPPQSLNLFGKYNDIVRR